MSFCGQWLRACSGSDQEADIRCNREAELPAEPIRARIGHEETNNIGLVVEDTVDGLENTILLDVVKGLGEATGDNNYDLLFCPFKPSTNKLADHLLDVYRKQSADGLILMGAAINQPYGS